MDSPWKMYTAILYCLALTVVQSFGNLVMLHHPRADSQTEGLSCVSEDDGAALIWTHSHNRQPISIEDFKPNRPAIGNVGDCAIRGKSACLAKWNETSGCDWKVVNSAIKPTGPIFDHRWEGFKEYRFPKPVERQDYQYVKEVDGSSGTVIFSVRGSTDVYIFMCKEKQPAQGPCIWIILAAWGGKMSKVVSCVNGAAPPYQQTMSQNCETVAVFEHGLTDVIDMYEWQTFRVELNGDQGTIAIYKVDDREPFMKGIISPWHEVPHVSVRSDPTSRIRFHFLDYMMTEKTDAAISTGSIEHSNKIFCAELLLGLCPTCKLNVSLVDGDGSDIMRWNISGYEQDQYNGLPIWQSVRLIKELNSEGRDLLKIKIMTVMGEEEGKGQWAIDGIRMCGSGKLRESKIMLDAGNADPVACQKLSYADNTIVRYVSPRNTDIANVLSELQQLLDQRNGKIVGKNGFICNRGGCICDRGYQGRDCAHECGNGFYGFNCKKKCGFCQYSENCVKSTGFCEAGCLGDRIAPFCKTAIGATTINDVTDTTATLLQSIWIDEDEVVDVTVQIQEAEDESWVNFPAKVRDSHHIRLKTNYVAYLTGMKPNIVYTVRTVVSVKTSDKMTLTFGPKYNFSTTPAEESTLVAVPDERSLTIQARNKEREIDCSDPDHRYSILVTDTLTNNVTFSASASLFPLNITDLTPFTQYQVKIIDTITQRTLLDTEIRTLESGPSEIRDLNVSSISDTEVTLQWNPPLEKNGIIRNYSVSLKLTELRGCKDLDETTPHHEEILRVTTETTAVFSGLHPYAKYVASVISQTSKPGPPATLGFETNFTLIPTSKVSNVRISEDGGRIEWDKPADCTTITGPTEVTRFFITRISDSALITEYRTSYSSFNLSGLSLEPFTSYKVRVHVVRGYDEPENPDVYQELIWRTDLADLEDPTVVNVTDRTAKIIQNVKYIGPDAESFVFFILRGVWSNRSSALLPTNTTTVEHELDLKNLKPNTLYYIHTLVTILEPEGPLTVASSPVLFKTKCSDLPQFEVSPGDGNLTIYMLSLPEDCEHPTDQLYSVKVYDTVEGSLITSLALRSFPLTILDLEPYDEYEVNVWIQLRLVSTRKLRASGSNETSVHLPSVN